MRIIMKQEIPDYGTLFTMKEFVKAVKIAAITDYDGSGYLSDGKIMTNIPVDCSLLYKGLVPESWSHVVWFNK